MNPLRLTAARRINLGKRAGVASGLLGVLCILAELCFLLPDLLVTRDALPMYAANIGIFRGILEAAIVATFVLGFYSTMRLRSKLHGLAGIALGSIALAMGGAEAQAIDIGSRPVAAGLDYFILELLVLGLVFIPLEQIFALHRQRIFRKGWQTDLKHFFFSHAFVQLLSFASMIPAQAAFAWALPPASTSARTSRGSAPRRSRWGCTMKCWRHIGNVRRPRARCVVREPASSKFLV